MRAAVRNNIEMARLLLDNGANASAATKVKTALYPIIPSTIVSLVKGEGLHYCLVYYGN
jgi:ankyrin repeat protein